MKKLLISAAVLGMLAAAVVAARPSEAASPYATDIVGNSLRDGDLISANQSAGDPDIFIIKFKSFYGPANPGDTPDTYNGFKRLFLNPAIFNMYGHLGGFSRVRQVSTTVRDSFVTSGLFRNCETNDQKVWATEVTGEDAGILHHVQLTGDQAASEDNHFFDKVFCINTREDNFYAKSVSPYYHLSEIPHYFRRACLQRPACLDSYPRCSMPEPIDGWCPTPTYTPPVCVSEGGDVPSTVNACCPGLTNVPVRDTSGNVISGMNSYKCSRPGCYYLQVECIRAPCNPVLVCPSPTPGCYPLPACAQPGANPVCDIAAYGPDGQPWCPYR